MAVLSPHNPISAALLCFAHAKVGVEHEAGAVSGLKHRVRVCLGFFLFVINPIQTIPASHWEFKPRMNSIISLESLANADHLVFIYTLQYIHTDTTTFLTLHNYTQF